MTFEKIRSLFDIYNNAFGFSNEEIKRAEVRLNIKFPLVLQQYYLQLGGNELINQSQNRLYKPDALLLESTPQGKFLIFYTENQGNVLWALKTHDLEKIDPPVFANYGDTWELECNNSSDFLLSMAYLQSLFALPFNANKIDISKKNIALIKENWKEVEFTLKIWSARFYQNTFNEIIAIFGKEDEERSLFIATKDKDSFYKITETLQIDWDYTYEDC